MGFRVEGSGFKGLVRVYSPRAQPRYVSLLVVRPERGVWAAAYPEPYTASGGTLGLKGLGILTVPGSERFRIWGLGFGLGFSVPELPLSPFTLFVLRVCKTLTPRPLPSEPLNPIREFPKIRGTVKGIYKDSIKGLGFRVSEN